MSHLHIDSSKHFVGAVGEGVNMQGNVFYSNDAQRIKE